jgi:cbb3-type cytochrome oxidase subunit 3
MKLTLLLAVLLVAVVVFTINARNKRAREAAAAALARQKAARRSRVPAVSNNVKGVTASQTIEPYRARGLEGGAPRDERAA